MPGVQAIMAAAVEGTEHTYAAPTCLRHAAMRGKTNGMKRPEVAAIDGVGRKDKVALDPATEIFLQLLWSGPF